MTAPLQTAFAAAEPEKIAGIAGRIAVFADGAARSTRWPAGSTG